MEHVLFVEFGHLCIPKKKQNIPEFYPKKRSFIFEKDRTCSIRKTENNFYSEKNRTCSIELP